MSKLNEATKNTSINVPKSLYKRIREQRILKTGSSHGVTSEIINILQEYYNQVDQGNADLATLQHKYNDHVTSLQQMLMHIVNGELKLPTPEGLYFMLSLKGLTPQETNTEAPLATDPVGVNPGATIESIKDIESTPIGTEEGNNNNNSA